MPKFKTAIMQAEGMDATGIVVPDAVVEKLASGKRPKVAVTLNGYTYRSTVAVMGGQFMLPLAKAHREAAGVKPGQKVEITLELDTAPREVEIPKDFAAALKKAGLRAAFDKLAFTHRKEHVRAIEEAKAPETRLRRIEKAVAMVAAKKK
jgi:bifunctional DNA-binding transcriptional regulator/antitoxin component of YhaV-PrlF toxin-antitoxin module